MHIDSFDEILGTKHMFTETGAMCKTISCTCLIASILEINGVHYWSSGSCPSKICSVFAVVVLKRYILQ